MKKILFILFLVTSQAVSAQNDFLIAENYYREGSYNKAAQLYEKLFHKNPFNTTYLKRLLTCYQETNQFIVAEKLLKSQINKNPTKAYINVELGYNYEKQQKDSIAKIYYDKAIIAIDKIPSRAGHIGRMFKQNNLLDYALSAFEKGMTYNPTANYNFQIAQIYGEQGKFEKMFTSYINLIDNNENYLNTVKRFTSRYISENPQDNRNKLLKKVLIQKSVGKPKDAWNLLLSWLFTQEKEYGKAFIQEKALFKRNNKYLLNITNLGHVAFENEAYNIAKQCFQFAEVNTPILEEKINAVLYLLKIGIATEQPNIEKNFNVAFSTYGKLQNTLPIQIEYADFLTFHKNKPQQAIVILAEALRVAPSKFLKASIKLKLGDILVFTGKFNKALIYFSQVQTSIKNHPLAQEARFKVAQTSYFKNDFSWSLAQLKVLKASTTQLIANDALELFLVVSDNLPKDSIPSGLSQYAKADLMAYQQKNKQAIDTLQSILQNFKGHKIEDEALFKQALLFTKTKQFEKALENYLKIIHLNKDGILVDDSLFYIAELYRTKLNNLEKASEYYQKIIFDHPSSIFLVEARKKYRQLRGDNIN